MSQDELYAKWDEIVSACDEYGDDPYPAWLVFLVSCKEQHPIPESFDFIKYSFDLKENHATKQYSVSIHD